MNRVPDEHYPTKKDVTVDVETETTSGPVYINEDPTDEAVPQADDLYASTGEEVNGYPEGAYQTWDPREEDSFEIAEFVSEVMEGLTEVASTPVQEQARDYRTVNGAVTKIARQQRDREPMP